MSHRRDNYDFDLAQSRHQNNTEVWAQLDIARSLRAIADCVCDLAGDVHTIAQDLHSIRTTLEPKSPIRGIITQGEFNMPVTGTITGLVPGTSDTFFVTPVDINGNADALPLGSPIPTFTADDAGVGLAPAADGLSVIATAPATATPGGSFNLAWAATFTKADGTTASITATANVPYLAPPALEPVGGVISQGKPAAAPLKAMARK